MIWCDVDSVTLNSAKAVHYALISINYTLLVYRQLYAQIKYFYFLFLEIFFEALFTQLKIF